MLLDKYDLTKSKILEGEIAEFDAVKVPKKERDPMYLAAPVDMIINDAFADLRDTLMQNDQLASELNEVKGQLDQVNADVQNANNATQKARSEAQIKQSDLSKLSEAEELLSDLEQTMAKFKAKRIEDGEHIQKLTLQVQAGQTTIEQIEQEKAQMEARDQEREDELATVTQGVNEVLDALQRNFSDLSVAVED